MIEHEFLLEGDISNELIDLISDQLKPHYPNLRLKCDGAYKEAHAITASDLLTTAAAIAAVLNFLFTVAKGWRNGKSDCRENRAKADIDDNLRSFKADGFELDSIEVAELDRNTDTIRSVKINDIVDQVTIEIKQKSEKSYSIRRIKNR